MLSVIRCSKHHPVLKMTMRFTHPLLTETRSAIALPSIVGTRDVRIRLGVDLLTGDGNGHPLNDGRQD